MKQEITPKINLEILSQYIIRAYDSALIKEKGSIQFKLKHLDEDIFCYYLADGEKMVFNFGELEYFDAKLTTSLYNWLDLANSKLNPVWGIITKKIKFEGDTKVFDKLIKKEIIFKINTDIFDPPTKLEINPVKNWKLPKKILIKNGSPRGLNG